MSKQDTQGITELRAANPKLEDFVKLLTSEQWEQIIIGVIGEEMDPQNISWATTHLFVESRSDTGGCYSLERVLRELLPPQRKIVCQALDSLVSKNYDAGAKAKKIALEALSISDSLGSAVDAELLASLVSNTEIDKDLRRMAGGSLLGGTYRNGVPAEFWKSINVTQCPSLTHCVMTGLIDQGYESYALTIMDRVPEPADECTSDEIQSTLETLIDEKQDGIDVVIQHWDKLPTWVQKMILSKSFCCPDETKLKKLHELRP